LRRVGDHLHIFKTLAQVTHPAVDFAQQLFVVLVLGPQLKTYYL
jgi:hypothetical protein